MEEQEMANAELQEQVVEEVELELLVQQHKYQELKQEMVEMV
jgi:hypothetical protein